MKLDNRYRIFNALNWGALGIYIPVLGLLCLSLGLDYLELGLVFATFAAINVILEVPTGGMADQYGRFKIYYLSKIVDISSFLIVILLPNFYGMMISSVLLGAGRALGSGTIEPWYVEQIKAQGREKQLHALLGKAMTFAIFSMAIGALLGGWLPGSLGDRYFPDNPYLVNVWLLMFVHIFIWALTPSLLHEGEKHTKTSNNAKLAVKKAVAQLTSHPVLKILWLGQVTVGFIMSSVEGFWQPFVKALLSPDATTLIFGALTSGYFLCGSLGSYLSAPICNTLKGNQGGMLFVMLSLSAALLFALASSSSVTWYSLLYCLFALTLFTCSPLIASILHQQVEDEIRSSMSSLFSLAHQAGGVGSGVVLGWLARQFSISLAWALGATFVLILAVNLLRLNRALALLPCRP